MLGVRDRAVHSVVLDRQHTLDNVYTNQVHQYLPTIVVEVVQQTEGNVTPDLVGKVGFHIYLFFRGLLYPTTARRMFKKTIRKSILP